MLVNARISFRHDLPAASRRGAAFPAFRRHIAAALACWNREREVVLLGQEPLVVPFPERQWWVASRQPDPEADSRAASVSLAESAQIAVPAALDYPAAIPRRLAHHRGQFLRPTSRLLQPNRNSLPSHRPRRDKYGQDPGLYLLALRQQILLLHQILFQQRHAIEVDQPGSVLSDRQLHGFI